ncbi:Deoxyribodipyrimidine photo-lyase [Mycena indigotica]|uniref:Deoxyribodipyrimidine photo-lyase n=1 Tax=Mycena indigotica TaxID=2126181 RepID=A0A8H6SPU7_9AGAR|nr:Deoxyribodipyrimidine photo-lyase [Mycena indigotica]KAF7301780.1 Deoxyribodipyrimidine photo-lyase [Mycena indigotica]
MKLVNKHIDKHGSGHVTLRPEDDEDMWHLYNLIQEGDSVRAPAVRRVQKISNTGSVDSNRVKLNLTIRVARIEFSSGSSGGGAADDNPADASAPAETTTASLHITGPVTSENQHVRLGAFHTLDIEAQRDIRIEKAEGWDSVALGRVDEAIVPGRGAEVAAVVCGEGTAAFCLLSQHMTLVTNRLSVSIPRKAGSSSQHEKGLSKFYSSLFDSFIRHVPYANVGLKAIVIASPGWVRDSVYDFIVQEASRRGDKILQKALKEKTIRVHVNSPHVHSLVEVLKSPEIVSQLKETKFAREGIVLDKFFKMLGTDEMRAWYGPDHVVLAADRGAIGTLLISDDLFRASNPTTRKKYVALVEAVQQKGGEVVIFSKLNQLTGIAAILTFPLDVEIVEAEEKEAEEETAVDADPPLARLVKMEPSKSPRTGESVVYWMRMGDLRVSDNRALSLASKHAKREGVPLIVIFVFSPQDYIAHDRGARRIDFTLRNLRDIQATLSKLHIPLFTVTQSERKQVPQEVIRLLDNFSACALYANIEYEVDELRRDIRIGDLASPKKIAVHFVHDKCVVEPGVVLTKEIKTYSVYTPYQKLWLAKLNADIPRFLEKCIDPQPNDESIRKSAKFGRLFDSTVPENIPGFELEDADHQKMAEIWPAGELAAQEILKRFMLTKARKSQLGAVDPLAKGADDSKHNRLVQYDAERDQADKDTTSRISPYLAAGIISARTCIRATLFSDRDPDQKLNKQTKVDGTKNTSIGRWVQEVAWRDFYVCILAGYPRVSMGRPFLEKYADVVWEGPPLEDAYEGTEEEHKPSADELAKAEENIEKWKAGKTGVPIVDAGMRCLNTMGWLHNRLRMICAMYLTKDLMIDWRVGEKYFMQQLIDGDLASNNGGWQWSASTGVDPCPYFRIFNPYVQSSKADPSGDFIRHYVPELAKLRGPELHQPSAATADKLGYPHAVVEHKKARERALRRFKNPGEV